MELRTILEWDVAPQLREVQGVTEINTHGGYYKTFEVRPDPDRLMSYRHYARRTLQRAARRTMPRPVAVTSFITMSSDSFAARLCSTASRG